MDAYLKMNISIRNPVSRHVLFPVCMSMHHPPSSAQYNILLNKKLNKDMIPYTQVTQLSILVRVHHVWASPVQETKPDSQKLDKVKNQPNTTSRNQETPPKKDRENVKRKDEDTSKTDVSRIRTRRR